MKDFALKYPFATGLIVFLAVFIGGTVAGIILSFVFLAIVEWKNPSSPGAHGNYMAMGMIWSLAFTASFILGILAGISTFVFLILKIKKREEQSYK